MRDTRRARSDDVVLGEDWVSPDHAETEVRRSRERRGMLTLNRSPLARKIITFNLIGLLILVAGVFYLNPFRDSLAAQRESGLAAEAQLVADVYEVQLAQAAARSGSAAALPRAAEDTGQADGTAGRAAPTAGPGTEPGDPAEAGPAEGEADGIATGETTGEADGATTDEAEDAAAEAPTGAGAAQTGGDAPGDGPSDAPGDTPGGAAAARSAAETGGDAPDLPQLDVQATLDALTLSRGTGVYVFAAGRDGAPAALLARALGPGGSPAEGEGATIITDFLNAVWEGTSRLLGAGPRTGEAVLPETRARALAEGARGGDTVLSTGMDAEGGTSFAVATPILREGEVAGVVALISADGEIDALVRAEREQVLQMFVIAILVSIGLSLVLASTIANPLSDLAAAAEVGRDRNTRQMSPGRVRIPDLSGRPDEIGRLSAALRGMVAALYDRIDANEQFAADVSHEIKNPLASLRSAVGTLRVAKREDQKERLCEVIEHDVRRLDRLVSDISNASRLDSELVKEEEEAFDLVRMLSQVCEHHSELAREQGVEFITDMPRGPMIVYGLEARLAQVFVNLIANAISFCEEGDAVRVWARMRENRVLVVVEDTGPGIPEQALTKIFNRFYSERPPGQFGDHSGLGLAISKQIVEAHGGVIWAENIRPTDADMTSEPLGARFVVGLPV